MSVSVSERVCIKEKAVALESQKIGFLLVVLYTAIQQEGSSGCSIREAVLRSSRLSERKLEDPWNHIP